MPIILIPGFENFPALTPPPGVEANFTNPPTKNSAIIAINVVFLILAITAVAIRLYVKGRLQHGLGWDDYTIGITVVASATHSSLMLYALRFGYGGHLWDIQAVRLLGISNVRKLNSISVVYPIVIFFVKLSILLLYLCIFGVNRGFQISIYTGIAFVAAFYTSYFGVQVAQVVECSAATSSAEYQLCANNYGVNIFQSVLNICTDSFIFLLTIPMIVKLHISMARKIRLLCIFLASLIACGVSIDRLVIIAKTLQLPDKFWNAATASELT